MRQTAITEILTKTGCLWINNNPPKYHAQLVSGLHSNGFINMRNLYNTNEGVRGLEKIIKIMSENLLDYPIFTEEPENIVTAGAAYGGIIPAYLLAKELWLSTIWTEKQDDGYQQSKFTLHGKKVVIVEDVLTTGSTVLKTMAAIKSSGGTVIDPIVCIVNRSNGNYVENRRIFSGINLFIKNYDTASCPWCKNGSIAIKPKFDNNWNKLITQE